MLLAKAINDTVVVSFTNLAFMDLCANWLASVRFHKIENFVVIALDQQAFELLKNDSVPAFFHPRFSTDAEKQSYLEGSYKQLVNLKTFYMYQILSRGFHVLLSDNDIVFVKVCAGATVTSVAAALQFCRSY